jgi:ankyrin repeat protein
VKFLVSKKGSVNLRDKDNITAIMEASMGGHTAVVEVLAKAGADIDATAVSGVSSLWLAAGEGHAEIVNLLLGKQANPNNKRSDGITALMAACAGGHEAIVKALLEAGADANAKVGVEYFWHVSMPVLIHLSAGLLSL